MLPPAGVGHARRQLPRLLLANGTSLADHSRELSRTWQHQRVYWGGACLWFQVDVEVRKKSRARARSTTWCASCAKVTRSTKTAWSLRSTGAGSPIATVALKREKKFDVEPLLKSLGVGVVKNERAALDDSALSRRFCRR